jgi:hypothetical protein
MSSSQELFAKALRAADRSTKRKQTRPFWSTGITLLLMFMLGFGLWAVYPKTGEERENAPVPIVRADVKPMKVVPEDPGGMEIPYRESTVFGAIDESSQEKQAKVEQLLPASETPMERDEIFARLEAEMSEEKKAEAKIVEEPKFSHEVIKPQIPPELLAKMEKGEQVDIKMPEVKTSKSEEAAEQPVRTAAEVKTEKLEASNVIESFKKPVKITVADPEASDEKVAKDEDTIVVLAKEIANTEPSSGAMATEPVKVQGVYYVQLGSVKNEAGIETEWKRLQKSFGDLLSGLSYRVKEADLGERGTYYRIQGGPLPEEKAYTLCSDIKAQKPGGCLVIKP